MIHFQGAYYQGARAPLAPVLIVALVTASLLSAAVAWGRRISGTRVPSATVALQIAFTALSAASVAAESGGSVRLPDTVDRPVPSAGPVVLVALDTVRADHLARYGYERDTMPRLEEFFRVEGVSAERALAASPSSLSTQASLFTGLDPPPHGVRETSRSSRSSSAGTCAIGRRPPEPSSHTPPAAFEGSAPGTRVGRRATQRRGGGRGTD